MTDHYRHKMWRSVLNPFFSKQKIATLEPLIHTQLEKLSNRIDSFVESGKVLTIGIAYAAFTMDVITDYAMEKSYGNLDFEDFNQGMANATKKFGKIWHLGKHATWFVPLFSKIPASIIKRLDPDSAQWKAFQEVRTGNF